MVDRQPLGDRSDHQLVRRSVSVAKTLLPVAVNVNVAKPRPALVGTALVNAGPESVAPICVVPSADLDDVDIAVLGPPGVVSATPTSGQVLAVAAFKRAYSGIEGHDFMVPSDAAQTAFLARWVR